MKLGICCVYFYGVDGDWLLPLQLRFIAESLTGYNYEIYAAANRLDPALTELLRAAPHVQIVRLQNFVGDASHEHAFYLDRLIAAAISNGCSHVVTVDSDSFPIVPNWPAILLHDMGSEARFSAVLRAENGDSHLPHPCGYFMHRSFYLERAPKLFPEDSESQTESFREFLSKTKQRFDTGIGYGYALWASDEKWLQLYRSNSNNPHFLMAGIYGGVFFHLGASSRRPSFYADFVAYPVLRIARWLKGVPFFWRVSRVIEERYLKKNERIFRRITNELSTAPDKFIARLSGTNQGRPDVLGSRKISRIGC